jgi:hypothetical protein
MGNFMNDKPTREAWQSYSDLVRMLMDTYGFTEKDIIPHGKATGAQTSCPGTNLLEVLKTPLAPGTKTPEKAPEDLSDISTVQLATELLKRVEKKI